MPCNTYATETTDTRYDRAELLSQKNMQSGLVHRVRPHTINWMRFLFKWSNAKTAAPKQTYIPCLHFKLSHSISHN